MRAPAVVALVGIGVLADTLKMSHKSGNAKADNRAYRILTWREYLANLLAWCGLGLRFLISPIPVLVLLSAAYFTWFLPAGFEWCREAEVRLLGLILQLCGFGTVTLKLLGVLRQFRPRKQKRGFRAYWNARPRRRVLIAVGRGDVKLGPVQLQGIGIVRPGQSASLEQRVSAVEDTIYRQHQQICHLQSEFDNHHKNRAEDLSLLETRLQIVQNRFASTLKAAMTDGLHLEWVGVLLFALGVVMAGASPEIAVLFGHLRSCG